MNKRGFSLLEVILVVTVMSILLGAASPNIIKGILAKYGAKTALDITTIQEAARAFFIDNQSWPANINDLTAAGQYLPSSWAGNNPFNHPYVLSSTPTLFTVSTEVQDGAQTAVTANLSATTISGLSITSSIGTPGGSASIPVGAIIPWATTAVPSNWFLCNGQSVSRTVYSVLFSEIGTTYGVGDGTTTFNLPDLRGRTIVGLDNMGGTNAGVITGNWGSTLGAKYGEENHRQTVAQMAPHSHAYRWWKAWYFSGSTELGAKGSYNDNAQTSITGGNGDGTGLGTPSNVVQPSIALEYIIKAK